MVLKVPRCRREGCTRTVNGVKGRYPFEMLLNLTNETEGIGNVVHIVLINRAVCFFFLSGKQ